MSDLINVENPFEPIYDENSTILILGSLPAVKSRKKGFYYSDSRNAFWEIISYVCGCSVPNTNEDKKQMLLNNHIAIWDICKSCDIKGSSDSSIKNETPTDIPKLLKKAPIQKIYANGKTAADIYNELVKPQTGIDIIRLVSSCNAQNYDKKTKIRITKQDKKRIWKETIDLI